MEITIAGLLAALATGAIIGLERGWSERERAEGGRIAGLRTFSLAGLAGGVLASLPERFGPWPLMAGLVAFGMLGAVSYREGVRASGNLSATSAVALLLTCGLGAMSAAGAPLLAVGIAVVVAMLLNLKPTLHRWLRHIEHRELSAALQMLVLSLVVLPWLPDRGFGPYEALNPYRLWWAVVLVAGLSLAGHVAMRFTGPQRGTFWTGVLGGLASSTAATLALARRSREQPSLQDAALAGTLGACGVMFFRMAVIISLMQPALIGALGWPLVAAGASLLLLSVWQWRRRPQGGQEPAMDEVAAFDLSAALGFGAFLGAITVFTRAAQDWWGDAGLYVLSGVSGLADVDAIVISVSRMHAGGALDLTATVLAVGIAAMSNLVTKVGIAGVTGGVRMGRRVLAGYTVAVVVGAVVALVVA